MVIFYSYVKLPEGIYEHLPYLPTNSPTPWRWLQDPACRLRFLRHEQTTGLMAAKLTGGREASNEPKADPHMT